jgi:hypothetical protein
MLVSYMGAQPQQLPAEHQGKTEAELNELGFVICPIPPMAMDGQTLWWENNSWVLKEPSEPEKAIKREEINSLIAERLAKSDKKIVELSEKHITTPKSILDYRDALRLLIDSENPFTVQLPDEPVIELTINDLIKAEAARRILEICPEWKQRNLTAQAAILAKKGEANWTPEEQAAWDAGEVIWAQIAAIRAKSDALEAMDPIPADFKDDSYWT